MASALTILLLGCWLAGWSGASGEGSDPKPSISVSPGGVIPVGGKVTIRCWHQLKNMRILLYKAGAGNYLTYTDPAGSEAEFPITSARRDHGGSYTCRYSDRSVRAAYSEPSNPVQIIVADPSLPRPSIFLSPTGVTTPGADVTIRCQGQRRDVRFFLHKAEDLNPQQHMDPAEDVAEFRIPSVGRQHGGNYSCSYQPRSEPFVSSQPSDPMELVVADARLPRPSISLSPTGVTAPGADVTIRCQGQCRDVRFFLHKAGDLNPQRHMDTAGNVSEFRIPSVGRQHGGNYSCSYRRRSEPFVSSQPSDTVELVVAKINSMTWPIIAGVSAAAAVLLLLVAFICFRKTRARKGAAPRPSSTGPMVALKAPAQQDSTYTSIDEGKQPQTPPQEPDPDGLTYAELNHQPLQAKRGDPAPAPQPAQPGVYATINVSRGAPQ